MNAKPQGLQALFGGTFDPIHYGHLRPVEALAKQVGLQKVILLPNHVPPQFNELYQALTQLLSQSKQQKERRPVGFVTYNRDKNE